MRPLVFSCLLAAAGPALAQPAGKPPEHRPRDGRVSGLDPGVTRAVRAIGDPRAMTAAEAQAVRAAIHADRLLSLDERDLVTELTSKEAGVVRVDLTGAEEDALELQPPQGEALRVLQTLIDRPNLTALVRAQAWGQLVDLHQNVPGAAAAIDKTLGTLLKHAVGSSAQLEHFSSWRKAILAEPEPTRREACRIFYTAAKRLDDQPDVEVSDTLYDWADPTDPNALTPAEEAARATLPKELLEAVLRVVRSDRTFSQVRGAEPLPGKKGETTAYPAQVAPGGGGATCESSQGTFGTSWSYRLQLPASSAEEQRRLFEGLIGALKAELSDSWEFRRREFKPYAGPLAGLASFSWRGKEVDTLAVSVITAGRGYVVELTVRKQD